MKPANSSKNRKETIKGVIPGGGDGLPKANVACLSAVLFSISENLSY